jgi:hypothetical protein
MSWNLSQKLTAGVVYLSLIATIFLGEVESVRAESWENNFQISCKANELEQKKIFEPAELQQSVTVTTFCKKGEVKIVFVKISPALQKAADVGSVTFFWSDGSVQEQDFQKNQNYSYKVKNELPPARVRVFIFQRSRLSFPKVA